MAWVLRQTKTNTADATATTIAATFDSNVTAGSLIIATVGVVFNSGNVTTVTGPDTFTKDGFIENTSDTYALYVFHAHNATAGPYTVTANFIAAGRPFRRIVIEEWGGALLSDPFDKTAGQRQTAPGTGTDAITSTASAATTTNGQLIHGALQNFVDENFSVGTGFTATANTGVTGTAGEYLIQGAAGAATATWTHSVDGTTYCIVTTYKAPATRPMFRGS
jgi:hypothetical protein